MTTFKELGLDDTFIKNLEKQGITEPTPIQAKSIPLILEGKDVIGESATGSGKTLAFGAGVVKHALDKKELSTMILAPTREIAQQITKVLESFSKELKVVAVYGGVSIEPQIKKLQTAQVMIGTPGRVLDHIERGTINLSKLSLAVLDEADRMLDMGFIDDIKKIFRKTPEDKQTVLFSATFPREVQQVISQIMRNPEKVLGKKQVDPSKLKQIYYNVPRNLKFSLLLHILTEEESVLTMIFCNTKRMVDILADNLKEQGIKARAIHGGFTQNKRDRSLQDVKDLKASVLICTDVAARGLDITDVTHVINYDLPNDQKDYVHRIGRTARAEKDGLVINLLARDDFDNFSRILRDYRFDIPEGDRPHLEMVQMNMPQGSGRGQRGRSPRSQGQNRNRSRGRGNSSRGSRDSDSDRPPRQDRSHAYGRKGESPERPRSRPGSRPNNNGTRKPRDGRSSDRPKRSFNRNRE